MQTYAAVTATDTRNDFLSLSRLHPRDRNRDSRIRRVKRDSCQKSSGVFRERDTGILERVTQDREMGFPVLNRRRKDERFSKLSSFDCEASRGFVRRDIYSVYSAVIDRCVFTFVQRKRWSVACSLESPPCF